MQGLRMKLHRGLFRLSTQPSARGKPMRAALMGLAPLVCLMVLVIHRPQPALMAVPGTACATVPASPPCTPGPPIRHERPIFCT